MSCVTCSGKGYLIDHYQGPRAFYTHPREVPCPDCRHVFRWTPHAHTRPGWVTGKCSCGREFTAARAAFAYERWEEHVAHVRRDRERDREQDALYDRDHGIGGDAA